jgi:hypothetical protein
MQDQSADAEDSRILRERNFNFLDRRIKGVINRTSLVTGAVELDVRLLVHFSLHDENCLASTLERGVGRIVVMRPA